MHSVLKSKMFGTNHLKILNDIDMERLTNILVISFFSWKVTEQDT